MKYVSNYYSNSNWYTITRFAISTQRVCTSHTQMNPCKHSFYKKNRTLLDQCFGNELQTHCPRGTSFWIKNVTVLAMNHRETASSSSSSSSSSFFFFFLHFNTNWLTTQHTAQIRERLGKQNNDTCPNTMVLFFFLLFLLFPHLSYTKPSPETFTNLTVNDIWDSDAIFSSIRLAGDNPRVIQRVTPWQRRHQLGGNAAELEERLWLWRGFATRDRR